MSKIAPIATTILGSEKAWGLNELNEQSPGNRGMHRYQLIYVLRDGIICEFRKDMGVASLYKGVKQLRIPAFFEHTVDELMDLADELRNELEIDIKDWLQLDTLKMA